MGSALGSAFGSERESERDTGAFATSFGGSACSRVVGGTLLETGGLSALTGALITLAVSRASALPQETHAVVPSTA